MNKGSFNQILHLLALDYFALFGIPPVFNINQHYLKVKYLDLQKQFHPDNFIYILSEDVKRDELVSLIVRLSAHINSGYDKLKNPLSRGVLLLKQHGIDLDMSKDTKLPEKFLFQQMDLRDNIESARLSGDSNLLETIESELSNLENDLILEITNLFCQNDYLNAKELLKQLAFYNKLKETVNNFLEPV